MVYYNRYQERYGQDGGKDSTNGNSTHGHDDHMEGDHHMDEEEGMSFSLDGVGTVTIDYDDASKYLALGAASAAAIALTL